MITEHINNYWWQSRRLGDFHAGTSVPSDLSLPFCLQIHLFSERVWKQYRNLQFLVCLFFGNHLLRYCIWHKGNVCTVLPFVNPLAIKARRNAPILFRDPNVTWVVPATLTVQSERQSNKYTSTDETWDSQTKTYYTVRFPKGTLSTLIPVFDTGTVIP